VTDVPLAATINQKTNVARRDYLKLTVGLAAGAVVLLAVLAALGVIFRRWHRRSHGEPPDEGRSLIALRDEYALHFALAINWPLDVKNNFYTL